MAISEFVSLSLSLSLPLCLFLFPTNSVNRMLIVFAYIRSETRSCTYVYVYVWYGMVWYGMVWYGMVWYGMYVCMFVCMFVCMYVPICIVGISLETYCSRGRGGVCRGGGMPCLFFERHICSDVTAVQNKTEKIASNRPEIALQT